MRAGLATGARGEGGLLGAVASAALMVLARTSATTLTAAVTVAATCVAVGRAMTVAVATLPVALGRCGAGAEAARATKAFRSTRIGLPNCEVRRLSRRRDLAFVLGQLRTNETAMEWTLFDRRIRIV